MQVPGLWTIIEVFPMNLLRMLAIANATKIIFEYGIKPVETDFKEFSPELYEAFSASDVQVDGDEKLYSWQPTKLAYETKIVLTVTEEHKELLLAAAEHIENHAKHSGQEFASYHDKLHYIASIFPPILTEGTKFGRALHAVNVQRED